MTDDLCKKCKFSAPIPITPTKSIIECIAEGCSKQKIIDTPPDFIESEIEFDEQY